MATLGIDVSKADFHAFLIDEGKEAKRSFPNTAAGFKQLISWLKNRGVSQTSACMEATGSYWEVLAVYLHEAGHQISVVNPSRTKAYAQSELLRTKTDAVDAAMIARFALAHKPPTWEPPSPETRMLQALVRHLEQLKATRAQQRTRLQTPGLPALVNDSIGELIAALNGQIDEIERAIHDHINQHPGLKEQVDSLLSIKGIGNTTASLILAEIPMIGRFAHAKAVAAYAGLSPRVVQSGSSIRKRGRISKTGNARLRKALYLPALTAMRFNPILRAFAQRLRQAGKPRMVVVVAVMRKLLVLAYGVLKSGRHFDALNRPAAA
jgi:transposase